MHQEKVSGHKYQDQLSNVLYESGLLANRKWGRGWKLARWKHSEMRSKKVVRRMLVSFIFEEYNLDRPCKQQESTEEQEMKQQQRTVFMKDMIKKIRSKERMDAKSRWWGSGLLATDCEKAWTHTGWENTMQRWYKWLEEMKKKDGEENMRKCISTRWRKWLRVRKEVRSLAQNLKAYSMDERSADFGKWRRGCEVVGSLRSKRKEWTKHPSVKSCRAWRISRTRMRIFRSAEKALPRRKEWKLEKVSRLYKATNGVGCDNFRHPGTNENQWVSAEDRRRRRVAFEETAKKMLAYVQDSEDLKVGVIELQEQLGISEDAGFFHQANCPAGNVRDGTRS